MSILRHCKRKDGIALVTALASLVLILSLVIAILTVVTSERSSSASYAAANSSRNLADLVVNLVQGQINDATTQGASKVWASQPGAIRVFNSDGTLNNIYRLYSASSLTTSAATDLVSDLPPASWGTQPSQWCDLNAPVTVLGAAVYPILDPDAASGANAVQGFALSSPPGATTAQPSPMPVPWLYVLQDGTIVMPTVSGSSLTVSGGSATNPIVGRIAFWTDDDTCRVNINTASEGTYWDTPRAVATQEENFANYQPAQNEFQRYPGHPAMASLSTVFPALTPDQIYNIVPRVVTGGSNEGTTIATGPLTPDSDRLFASVGELLFNESRGSNALTKNQLEQAKFFLTAHSSAPEVNLFGKPRISIWPIAQGMPAAQTTPFDQLAAFCSTITLGQTNPANYQDYYFQRNNANYLNSTGDISIPNNQGIYSYLQYLTSQAVPGFGGNFLSKYPSDRDQILTEIFDYIRCANSNDGMLTAGNQYTPGFNADGVTYQPGHGWVAPTKLQTSQGNTLGFGRTYTLSQLAIGFICNAVADDPTTPAVDESSGSNVSANVALGGTVLTTGQKCVQAILLPELFTVMNGYTGICPGMQVEITGLNAFQINGQSLGFPSDGTAIYSLQPSGMTHGRNQWGSPGWRYAVYYKDSNVDSPAATNLFPFIGLPVKLSAVPAIGGTMSFTGGPITVKIENTSTGEVVQTLNLNFPNSTFPIPNLVTQAPTDTVEGSVTLTKSFWWAFQATGSGVDPGVGGRLRYSAFDTGYSSTDIRSGAFFNENNSDVVRSILPSHGDFRLIAGSAVINDPNNTIFVPHPYYNITTMPMAHTLSGYNSWTNSGKDLTGKYISSITYDQNFGQESIPEIPDNAVLTNRPESTGDYDTGVSDSPDGPFINKPDEGNTYRSATSAIPYFTTSQTDESGGSTFFSPNRQMPSPGMFGSLPTGVMAGKPWQTLLFRPQITHPSYSTTIPDHLMMDLFWMPVVQPYAISQPFSTAGKINMNYQIEPFTYITRSTGIRALLKAEEIAAIPNTSVTSYKSDNYIASPGTSSIRLPIDPVETLKQFQLKFSGNDIFKSATEICNIHMIPSGTTLDPTGSDADSVMSAFWTANALTGDNLRERIYTTLYPRLTTKSNSYTVYFTVQSLRNPRAAAPNVWNETIGKVLSEYRGSTSLERYIDPAETAIPNYLADPSSADTLDEYYRWRITGNRQFAP